MKTEELLEDLGLSPNEIKAYLGLLAVGESTTTPLAKHVEVPISKIYPTLDRLIQKGLVSYIIKNKVKHFNATDPQRIVELLEKRENKINTQKKEILKIIPTLRAKQTSQETQEARIYEGINGIKTVYKDILTTLKKRDTYYVFNLGSEDTYEKHKFFFRNYHLKREKKSIKVKILTERQFKSTVAFVFKELKHAETRFVDKSLPSSTVIYGNKVATILLGKKPTAIVVQSIQNAKQYKRFFLDMWKQACK
jgi:HTH-type transcriptional regulator, sugar sensing transcriptional regulator